MPPVLQSRKLWAAIVGLALIIVNALLNHQQIDPNTVTNGIMGIIAAYMASVAWEDGKQHEADAVIAAAPVTTVSTPGGSDVTVKAAPDATPVVVPVVNRINP